MKKYYIEWETDFCDCFPEKSGSVEITAESEIEAIRKFNALRIQKACISYISTIDAAG